MKKKEPEQPIDQILGQSPAILQLREKIRIVAGCDVSILIIGESGSGKELAARAIHGLSKRAEGPFIPINCGAIPETLFENELFGHAQGAYTDARSKQVGLLKEGEGGTVFFDEISAISLFGQVKLLRLLQDKQYKPLGATKPQTAKVRIIAATNKDLGSLVKNGAFREDLYYRLDIVELRVPPLRERRQDIPLLVEHFVSKYTKEYDKPIRDLSVEVMEALLLHSWPGNVRELENRIQELVVMSSFSSIKMTNVLSYLGSEPSPFEKKLEPFKTSKQKIIDVFESAYLANLLKEFRGDVARAAASAGKSRTSLWNLIKKHNFHPKDFRI